jgi:NADPH:quinone reductase-like Zn-dependent oxidoreductase
MKAAVLHTLGKPPRFEDFPDPQPRPNEAKLRVKAASLKNIDKAMASGSHYDSHAELPIVCGIDGVGILDDGTRVFCGGSRPPYGMMAEYTVVPRAWCLPIPDGVDDVTAAALPNPALSSWLPLVWRARLERGETVLILGATGVAGKLAIQIAKHLGAKRVVAAGRNEKILKTLPEQGADATIALDQPDQQLTADFVREAAHGRFDVVLDYLWGHPTSSSCGAHGPRPEGRVLRNPPGRDRRNGWLYDLTLRGGIAQLRDRALRERRWQYSAYSHLRDVSAAVGAGCEW